MVSSYRTFVKVMINDCGMSGYPNIISYWGRSCSWGFSLYDHGCNPQKLAYTLNSYGRLFACFLSELHLHRAGVYPHVPARTRTAVHRRPWRFVSFNVLRHCLKYTVTVVFTCIQLFLFWQWFFHATVAKHVVLPQRGVNFQRFWIWRS